MKNIEKMIESIVDRVINEEINDKVKKVTKSVEQEIDEMEEYYQIAKKRKEERMSKDKSQDMGDSDMSDEEIDEEVEEGNAFSGARAEAIKKGQDTFEVNGKTYPVTDEEDEVKTESKKRNKLQLTEDELIDLIERIIMEQKIEGNSSEKTAMKKSEKDSDSNIKMVNKKMKEYLKDGSEGDYEMNPKDFPKGNKDKREENVVYVTPEDIEEYIEQVSYAGGMENLEYDQIKPNDEWLDLNLVGSSKTGNNPEWANSVETEVNKEVKKRKDKNVLNKLKKQSYKRVPQPIEKEKESKTKKFADIEVNENIKRMKNLISHNYKTQ